MTTYTIQSGDNLTKIAKAHNTTVSELARINGISNPDKIMAGKTIKLFEDSVEQTEQVEQPQSQEELEEELNYMQNQFEQMQAQMNTNEEGYNAWEVLGLGLGAYAGGRVIEASAPHVLKGAKTAVKAVKNASAKAGQTVANKVRQGTQSVTDEMKVIKNKAAKQTKKIQKEVKYAKKYVVKNGKKLVKTAKTSNNRAGRLLSGKTVRIKGQSIKLNKAGKLLGKAAVPLTVATSLLEVGSAYERGGVKEAAKTGSKCAAGVAAGWAGAKIGAAIGTAICPGIGTAIGGFVGGIAGYLLGEKAAEKVIA